MKNESFILRVSCPDQPGVVAAVANCLQKNNCNIEDAAQFNDTDAQGDERGLFFMRVVFTPLAPDASDDINSFKKDFAVIADHYGMTWNMFSKGHKTRTVLMVSKQDHCLNDILYRTRTNQLPIDIRAIISNHPDAEDHAERYNIPFYHFPITAETKPQQETKIREIFDKEQAELIVLARYMQILSTELSDDYEGKIINIHHSFLPGFKGAKPYHQAYDRGVKLIGATAHFVTPELDEGPIIEQNVTRVSHKTTPQKMTAIGRDIEAQVLARALEYFSEHRIFLHDNRTVIL